MRTKLSLVLVLVLACGLLAGSAVAQDKRGTVVPPDPFALNTRGISAAAIGTLAFRTDSGYNLDQYLCGTVIAFPINVHGIDPTTASSVKLTMAVYDIDFNCNGSCSGLCERDTVYVNGNQLTSPMSFLTGANDQWSTVSFDVPAAFLVEGDNNIQIYIDVLSHSCWCAQCDWGELSLTVGPEIEDIEVLQKQGYVSPTYNALSYPVTTKRFYVRPKMKNMTGYELVKAVWSGDCAAGEGNPYGVTIPAGEHGRKNITCRVVCRNIATSDEVTITKSKQLNVYFRKDEDDQGRPVASKVPNWFTYWKRDGAVPNMTTGNFQYTTDPGLYGKSVGSDLFLGSGAGGVHYPGTWTIPASGPAAITFGGPGTNGIDCAAEVCAHEMYHKSCTTLFGGRPWPCLNPADPDPGDCDGLPDWYEIAVSGTLTNISDTEDVAGVRSAPDYAWYGDQEWMAMQAGHGQKGVVKKDWAYPGGKQAQSFTLTAASASSITVGPAMSGMAVRAVSTGFTGAYSAQGIDTNANTLFDTLTISAGVVVQFAGYYDVSGLLKDGSGNLVGVVEELIYMGAGSHTVSMAFDGVEIHKSGHNGPFHLTATLTDGDAQQYDSVTNAFTTVAYTLSQFEGNQAYIGAPITSLAQDTDADLRYEQLTFTVPVVVTVAGTYDVNAFLANSAGIPICPLNNTVVLATGTQAVTLTAQGPAIRQSKLDGPYKLMGLEILDGETQTDFTYDAYTTGAFAYTDFESGLAEFGATTLFTDAGIDLDANGLFDLLRITMPVMVNTPGTYALMGRLFDGTGNLICESYAEMALGGGTQNLDMDFSGQRIRTSGQDGPYQLSYAFLYDPANSVADSIPGAYTTGAYTAIQFEPPSSVAFTRQFNDTSVDTNADGTYESLDINVGVYANTAGTYALNGRLMDKNGGEIVWASTTSSFAAGESKMLTLSFSGPAIYANGVNGPFNLKDLYIYDMSNPSKSDTLADAYTTSAAWSVVSNSAPVADAGPDQTTSATMVAGAPITLDGSGSTDPDSSAGTNNDIVTFEWLEDGTVIATGVNPTATFAVGTHTVTLRVTDSGALQSVDTVQITVTPSFFLTWGTLDLPATLPIGPCVISIVDMRAKAIQRINTSPVTFGTSVRLTNAGDVAWAATDITIAYRWRNGVGATVLQGTQPLGLLVRPGQTIQPYIRFAAPGVAGTYTLEISAQSTVRTIVQNTLPTDTAALSLTAASSFSNIIASPNPFVAGSGRTVAFVGRISRCSVDALLGWWDGRASTTRFVPNGVYKATGAFHGAKFSLGFNTYGGK